MTDTRTLTRGAARTVDRLADGVAVLDDGRRARRAVGCLVRPEAGDRVLVWDDPEGGDRYILSVLERPDGAPVTVEAAGDLEIRAGDRLSLAGAGGIALSAPLGTVSIVAQRLTQTAIDGLTLVARTAIATADCWMIQARDVLTTRAHHHLMSARKEMRLEADRIQLS